MSHRRSARFENSGGPETAFAGRSTTAEWRGPVNAIRASDAEREAVAAVLKKSAAEGRLTIEELEERLGSAYSAKTYAELMQLSADLPDHNGARTSARGAALAAGPRDLHRSRGRARGGPIVLIALFWTIWAVSVATSPGHSLEGLWPLWLTSIWGLAFLRRRGRALAPANRDHAVGPT